MAEEPPTAKRPRSLRVSLTLPPSSPLLSTASSKQGSPLCPLKQDTEPSMECESSSVSPLVHSVRASLSSNGSTGKVSDEANISTESIVDDVFTDTPMLLNEQALSTNDDDKNSSSSPVNPLSVATTSCVKGITPRYSVISPTIADKVTTKPIAKPVMERPTELPLLPQSTKKLSENLPAPAAQERTVKATSAAVSNRSISNISPVMHEGIREPSPLERLQMEIRGSRLSYSRPLMVGSSTALATIKAKQIKLASVASSSHDRRKSQSDKTATHASCNKEVSRSSTTISTITTSSSTSTSEVMPTSTDAVRVITSVPNGVVCTSSTDTKETTTGGSCESVVVISPSPSPVNEIMSPVKISPVNVSGRKLIVNNKQPTSSALPQAVEQDNNTSTTPIAKPGIISNGRPRTSVDLVAFSKHVIEATRPKTMPPAAIAPQVSESNYRAN